MDYEAQKATYITQYREAREQAEALEQQAAALRQRATFLSGAIAAINDCLTESKTGGEPAA